MNRRGPRGRIRLLTWGLCVVMAGGAVWFVGSEYAERRESIAQLGVRAAAEFRRREFATSEQLCRRILQREPENKQALLMVADALQAQGRDGESVVFYDRYPDEKSDRAIHARSMAGTILFATLHQPSMAEQRYRQVLEISPRDNNASRQLAAILGSTGRIWEASPFRMIHLMGSEIGPQHLHAVAVGRAFPDDTHDAAFWESCARSAPQDPAPLLALAQLALQNGMTAQVLDLLRRAEAIRPDLVAAKLMVGRVLSAPDREAEFRIWLKTLPEAASRHPGIWSLRGSWAAEHDQPEAAARCYLESLRLDPTNADDCYRLGMILSRLGRQKDAEPLLARARLLQQYVQACEFSLRGWEIEKAAALAEQLELRWEAFAWWKMIAFSHLQDERPDQGLEQAAVRARQLAESLQRAPLSRTPPDSNPVRHLDLSTYPLPDPSGISVGQQSESAAVPGEDLVHFEDQASAAGIHFSYFNGQSPDSGHLLDAFHQMNGGGVAVSDFDLDGWPDILLTQGCAWPADPGQQTHLDRLFRNQGDGSFVDVTAAAAVSENGFSQGATVGDVNQDGFADLYVANIGRNRLYISSGDGTFTEPLALADADDRWTVSCLMADLNNDRLPELFDVNYLEGDDVFERVCHLADGTVVTCSPASFAASQDQLHLNLGDGHFADCSAAAGIEAPDGRGLGAVAADFGGRGKLDLFVANDLSPNFLFRNEGQAPGDPVRFAEVGTLAGVAFDERGAAQACMGIAVGDVNRDQRLDLFVTNFYEESNTLYVTTDGELYRDVTRHSGLAEPSFRQLGFGTQCLDAELDGDPDLILTNGNIDDLESRGIPCRMPPQLMLNDGQGRFEEAPAASVGPFFEGRYLGRGLARLDWNRDGLDDVVISHLDVPAALLTNTTQLTGHFLCLRLIGEQSEREAIGTTVICVTGELTQMQQVTAGDGFAASNERVIRFGLSSAEVIDVLQVRWISGATQEFRSLTADQHLLLIEGRAAPLSLPF